MTFTKVEWGVQLQTEYSNLPANQDDEPGMFVDSCATTLSYAYIIVLPLHTSVRVVFWMQQRYDCVFHIFPYQILIKIDIIPCT